MQPNRFKDEASLWSITLPQIVVKHGNQMTIRVTVHLSMSVHALSSKEGQEMQLCMVSFFCFSVFLFFAKIRFCKFPSLKATFFDNKTGFVGTSTSRRFQNGANFQNRTRGRQTSPCSPKGGAPNLANLVMSNKVTRMYKLEQKNNES